MANTKLSTIEAICIILSIFVAHSLVSLPKALIDVTKSATILNLLIVGFIALFFIFIIIKLLKAFPGLDIIDISEYLAGKKFKNIVGIIFISYFIFSSSILLRNFCECLKIVYYPMTSILFLLVTFIIAISMVSYLNFKSVSKVNLIIIPLTFISVLFIFFSNIRNFTFENIYPIFGENLFQTFILGLGNLGAFSGITIIYFLPNLLKKPEDIKKISIISIVIAIIYLILSISIILFMFASLIEIDEIMPIYSAARNIEFGSFFQRLESIFLLIWIIQITCYLSINFAFCIYIFKKITKIEDGKKMVLPFAIFLFSASLLPNNYAISNFLETKIYPFIVISITFILSFLILLLGYLKKNKKRKVLKNE